MFNISQNGRALSEISAIDYFFVLSCEKKLSVQEQNKHRLLNLISIFPILGAFKLSFLGYV